MSPGSFPIHLPKPSQSSPPTITSAMPSTTRAFPISFIQKNSLAFAAFGDKLESNPNLVQSNESMVSDSDGVRGDGEQFERANQYGLALHAARCERDYG